MKFALTALSAGVAILATGGMTGVFFAYSTAIMPGLDAVRASSAIEAMQHGNRKILNPLFLASFLGAPGGALLTGVLLLVLLQERPAALLFIAAAAVYFLGSILPTAIVNVPMNNALDVTKIPADAAEAARVWAEYSPRWTRWNNLRGIACAASLLLIGLGTYVWGRS